MNQDQVKKQLLRLEPDTEEFTVVFSGKKSRKVHGLYESDIRKILLHNKNFADDNDLMYTAIHEFAHHLHFTRSPVPISSKAHTTEFWSIFHGLLGKAEEMEIYQSVFDGDSELAALTKKIRDDFLARNGKLIKELGGILAKAEELCRKKNLRFEDYVSRVLCLDRSCARLFMRVRELDIDPALGFDNMKTVAALRDEGDRAAAQAAFLSGKSPDSVKAEFANKPKEKDPAAALLQEKRRIERTIASLQSRLTEIDDRLTKLDPP
ncbi:MAG: hypothetical protein FWG35_00015 [Spirochaetaceae bacterium]|nr:hypothetical protein [Spirochaetaceae bacterium]